jgi:hypothetical protein
MFGLSWRWVAVLAVVLFCAVAWGVVRLTTPDDAYYRPSDENLPVIRREPPPTPSP